MYSAEDQRNLLECWFSTGMFIMVREHNMPFTTRTSTRGYLEEDHWTLEWSRVLYISTHRYEYGHFWPNLIESDFDHVGEGEGRGYNVNIPLNKVRHRSQFSSIDQRDDLDWIKKCRLSVHIFQHYSSYSLRSKWASSSRPIESTKRCMISTIRIWSWSQLAMTWLSVVLRFVLTDRWFEVCRSFSPGSHETDTRYFWPSNALSERTCWW